jgi:hypothetical protein
MFVWARLQQDRDAAALARRAIEERIMLAPGNIFCPDRGVEMGWRLTEARHDYFLVPTPITRKRSTASLGPKSSSSNSWRTSISPSLPSTAGLGKRFVHSIPSSLDFT